MKITVCGHRAACSRDNSIDGNYRPATRACGSAPSAASRAASIAAALLTVTLASCGGGGYGGGGGTTPPPPPPTQYSIGGTVSGLSGTGLVLQDNGGDNLTVTANGAFTFATKVNSGGAYAVTVLTQPTNPAQTCTVTNGSGTASANVTNVTVACTTNPATTVSIGGAVSRLAGTGLVLEDNGGDDLTVNSNGTFTFNTGLATGTAYAVTVKTQPTSPTQYCVVENGSGTTAAANVTTVSVMCAEFAYTVSNTNGTIYEYSIDPTTGALTQIGTAADGTAPAAVSLAPNGMFAYSASDGGMEIYAFTIDQSTGILTPVAGSPFPTGFNTSNPFPDIAVDPTSHYLYIASSGSHVAGFSINQTTGALTALAGSPYPAGTGANGIPAFSPNAQFLYVIDQSAAGGVSGYSVNPTTGVLTPITGSPFTTGADPDWISLTPDGKYAYVANTGALTSAAISAFAVNPTTGALTPLATPMYSADGHPTYLNISASGAYLYVPVLDSPNGWVDVYAIGADGSLTKEGTPAQVGIGPKYVSIVPSGAFAYVPSAGTGGTGIYGFSISASTGELTSLGAPFPSGSEPQFLTIDPSGRFAYAPNQGSASVSEYSIGSDGILNTIGPALATGGKPGFVSLSPEQPGFRD
jgi:6-phosphogluconolactonase (cycloisomerase 2 family)